MVRVCVLFAAGTNCDQETVHALELAGAAATTVHVNEFRNKRANLKDFHALVVPGGFSYGDYIASGKILAGELVRYMKDDISEFHAAGKPILGICNGFQVLVKSGLLPAFDHLFEEQTVTLDWNDSGRYEDRWVRLQTAGTSCVFTQGLPETILLPVAHAEGKFIPKNRPALDRLQKRAQIVFRYVGPHGQTAGYPDNPNGSVGGVAAICDPSGLIMGMMPHPERFVYTHQHPHWHRRRSASADGITIFENAVKYAKQNL
ncbi:MAG: phosphoribosylformylglycinamidine synthase I [candidate division WOR-3 bacterium]|nr:MAG: phosphoribosylformylglycinamidine synthase I [candidate division WOR-3 bacterium]